jgi:hypothetical protein
MTSISAQDTWTKTIQQFFTDGKLTSHQCIVYNKGSYGETNEEKCGCQRPIRHHSFDGTPSEKKPKPEDWNVNDHTKKLEYPIYHSTPSRKVRLFKSYYIY